MKRLIQLIIIVLVSTGLIGCTAKEAICVSPTGEKIAIKAWVENGEPTVSKDRDSFLGNAYYNNDTKVEGNVFTGSISSMTRVFSASGFLQDGQIRIDGDKNTVELGTTIYTCGKDLKAEIDLLKSTSK